MFLEFTTKLQRHEGDVELAILEYLGGGREGTKENRIERARRHNDDPGAYARRAQEAYDNGVTYGGNLYTGFKVWSHGQYWKKISNRSIETGI